MDDFTRALGFDPEKVARDAGRLFDRMEAMHRAAADLTVRAESGDGRVAVEYSSTGGVQKIEIDPRAMRMASGELAETILDLIHQTRRDAETRARARAAEVLDADNSLVTDRQVIGDRLRDAAGTLQENLRTATETMERLHAVFRR
ncbi:DNA-binding protein YbaB [Streptosporangium album]|uniref:DNA-binding protein YbaB n=1 Tax=Streptosporangium album TaxID=47479 RepID=A0A7W7W9D4_9ACTN|nr:YbaB/EbfC family nucleoid-associated protein [Streptosporangium album]MBB4938848.1 DNA-binding protein YbaB [Streptosporangium album]